jgi:quinol-cytochrome oxidoreductase complex cytochrome b subunit
MRGLYLEPLFLAFYRLGFNYPAPVNLSYAWNFGSLAFFFLIVQIVTGVFLASHYVPNVFFAFQSVEYIMREVEYGWLLRYIHANGASFFFFFVYCHMFRNWYYMSYEEPRSTLWASGALIYCLMVVTAFMGYTLPWGQMSYWAATVITSFFTAIPYFGLDLVYWFWGGFSVDNATLNRFYSFHYFLPFLILFVVFLHIFLLHESGSSNPLSFVFYGDVLPFMPYFVFKDLLGIIFVLLVFISFVCFFPNFLGHPDNYVVANPLVTPTHIVPEWYFLFLYSTLRSVPDKLAGIFFLVLMIFTFFFDTLDDDVDFDDSFFLGLHEWLVIIDLIGSILFTWLGGLPVEWPYDDLGDFLQFFFAVLNCIYIFDVLMWRLDYELYEKRVNEY